MTITNKILLSSTTTLALLLSGCGGDSNDVSGDTNTPPVYLIKDPSLTDMDVPTSDPKPPVDSYKRAGWYGKTQVSATATDGKVYTHNTAGVFGELVQSDDEKDQHDILKYKEAIFQVVFPQTEWEDDNGDYLSNYLNYDENSVGKRVWTFQIKNQNTVDLSNALITINLDGIYDISYREKDGVVEYKESTDINRTQSELLNLVDVDNSTTYTLNELNTANLSMNGLHTRTFRWVIGEVDNTDYDPLQTVVQKVTAFRQSKVEQIETIPKVESKFGLPPQ